MDEKRFTEHAAEHMQTALRAWQDRNTSFAVLHAGMGCEHACKALLVRENPLLIAGSGDQAHTWHSLGRGQQQGIPPLSKAKTIGLTDAFKRATVVMQGRMPITQNDFELVVESRNGEAHLAYHDAASAERALATAVALAEAIRTELGTPAADWWGPFEQTHANLAAVSAQPAEARPLPTESEIMAAVEQLALRSQKHAVHAADSARAVHWATGLHYELRTGTRQEAVTPLAFNGAVCTALSVIGKQAQRDVAELLDQLGAGRNSAHRPAAPGGTLPTAAEIAAYLLEVERCERLSAAACIIVARATHGAFIASMGRWSSDLTNALHRSLHVMSMLDATRAMDTLDRLDGSVGCPACGNPAARLYGETSLTGRCCDDPGSPECPHPDSEREEVQARGLHCPVCSLELLGSAELESSGIPVDGWETDD